MGSKKIAHLFSNILSLIWGKHKYLRPETNTEANNIVVTAHNQLPLALYWGNCDVASVTVASGNFSVVTWDEEIHEDQTKRTSSPQK